MFKEANNAARDALDMDGIMYSYENQSEAYVLSKVNIALVQSENYIKKNMPELMLQVMERVGNRLAKNVNSKQTFVAAALPDWTEKSSFPETEGINISFDLTNPRAVAWAKTRSSSMITLINNETRATLQALIARAFAGGITPLELSRSIRNHIGLLERQSAALLKFRTALGGEPGSLVKAGRKFYRIPKGGYSVEKLNEIVDRYAFKLLNDRAKMISRTECIASANAGQQELWLQSQDKGYLPPDQKRYWYSNPDCCVDICAGLNNEEADLNGPFPSGLMGPPAHPNCRCGQGLRKFDNAKARELQERVKERQQHIREREQRKIEKEKRQKKEGKRVSYY